MKTIILTSVAKGTSSNGDERYANELISNLEKNKKNNFILEVIRPKKKIYFLESIIFDLFILPFKIIMSKGDLYHATSPGQVVAPILLRKKTIVTIHDVIYMTFPEGSRLLKRLYFYFCLFFIKRADLIITCSDFSKKEITETLNIIPDKVKRIYLGIDDKFKNLNFKNKKNIIGYLGGKGGRKNIGSLIRAVYILKKEKKLENINLYISSSTDKKMLNLIKELDIANNVFFKQITEDKIINFYNSLKVFVFPSLYEGFGFPPLEAMACGCPVICSNKSSVSEVVGGAAIRVDTKNPHIIAKSILKVFTNPDLEKKMKTQGLLRSEKYRWEKTAINTLNVYRKIIKK